jgi:O-methyltransferase
MRFLDDQNRLCRLAFGLRLDTRTYPFITPATVDWYDIDLHDVIALRRRLFELRAGLHVVGVSVTDPQLLGGIAGDREILVVAEGLTPYLRRTDGLAMLRRIVGHFESGEMLLDGFSRAGVWLLQRHPPVKASGAQLDWSIGDPRELERAVPGLVFLRVVVRRRRRDPPVLLIAVLVADAAALPAHPGQTLGPRPALPLRIRR